MKKREPQQNREQSPSIIRRGAAVEGFERRLRRTAVSRLATSLKGLAQWKDTGKPAPGYVVKVFAPELQKGEQPLAQAVTDRNGYWSVELQFAARAGELLRYMSEKGRPNLRLEVYEREGSRCHRVTLSKDSDWRDPILLEVPTPAIPGLTKRDLTARGRLINRHKKLPWKRLRVEVWDRHSNQEESLAQAPVQDDGRFTLEIPGDKAFGYSKSHPLLWLRVRDVEDDIILALGRAPLAFDRSGEATQELRLPARLPARVPQFNPRKRLTELHLAVSPDDIRKLHLAGVKTLKDVADMKGAEVANKVGIDLGGLRLLSSFAQDLLHHQGEAFRQKRDLSHLELAAAGQLQFRALSCLPPMEDLREYRFSEWDGWPGGLTKVQAATLYIEECVITPYWPNQRIRDWLRIRRWLFDRYSISVAPLEALTGEFAPFAYNAHAVGLELTDLSNKVGDKIKFLKEGHPNLNWVPGTLIVSTVTGSASNADTDDHVELYVDLPETSAGRVTQPMTLDNPSDDREKGQTDRYTLDLATVTQTISKSLFGYGHFPPMLSKEGTDAWLIADWRMEVIHEGASYVHLPGIGSEVWLDAEGGLFHSEWSHLVISDWSNPYQYWVDLLQGLQNEIGALKTDLDTRTGLRERLDDILEPVLEGNKRFLLEEAYDGAVAKYWEALTTAEQFADSADRSSDGYRRLQYLLSLHIGDCYWGHREYERAVNHFLTDTCPKRNEGTWDDHFLWNHVAACMLDWADHRYRAASGDQQKRYEFGKIEKSLDPIDADPVDGHPYDQTDSQGAHALYSRVLERCFSCGSDARVGWFRYWLELFESHAITRILILLENAEAEALNKLRRISLNVGEREGSPLVPDPDVAKQFNVAAAYSSKEFKPLKARDFEDLALLAESSEPVPFQGIQILGLGAHSGRPVKIIANRHYTGSFGTACGLRPVLILREFGGCDLRPSESACDTLSDLLLLRAEVGVSSIEACLNPLGLRDDYIPAYRFKTLEEWALADINAAKDATDRYISSKRILEETLDADDAHDQAVTIAAENTAIAETLVEHADLEVRIANERINAIDNQIAGLNDASNELFSAGQIGMFLNIFRGWASMAGASSNKGGAAALAGSYIDLVQQAIETGLGFADIERRSASLRDERVLAQMEAAQAVLQQEVSNRRKYIASLEEEFAGDRLKKAHDENYRNPEVWHRIAEIQKRLLFSTMNAAIFSCWRVQKAVEFEIEAGSRPDALVSGLRTIQWKPIRFDYLDHVLGLGPGDTPPAALPTDLEEIWEAATSAQTSPFVVIPVATWLLADDLRNLVEYHRTWYDQNIPHMTVKTFRFSESYPLQLAQIRNATGPQVRVHFWTDVKTFDALFPAVPAYGRVFYVQCFYDAASTASDFSGYLTNTYEFESTPDDIVRNSLSYWRVPDDRGTESVASCNPELNEARYLDDWLDHSSTTEGWVLKAKSTEPHKMNVYNIGSDDGQEAFALTVQEFGQTFLNTFENTGIHGDWTLYLQKPPFGTQAPWSSIYDIVFKVVYKASEDHALTTRITNQLYADPTVRHNYVLRFRQAPEHQAFEQIFDPNNRYTDQIGLPGDRIEFTILEDGTLPGSNRQMKALYLIFFFDETVTPLANVPSLTARLTKTGVVDGTGQPVEIVFVSPTQTDSPAFQLPNEFVDQEPAGDWAFKMVTADNLDANGNPKNLAGLIDILLIIEYEYLNA